MFTIFATLYTERRKKAVKIAHLKVNMPANGGQIEVKNYSREHNMGGTSKKPEKGKTTKPRILVGTDVTDNYIILVGTDSDKFGANEKTIDEIWGSFGMYSGGASGNS